MSVWAYPVIDMRGQEIGVLYEDQDLVPPGPMVSYQIARAGLNPLSIDLIWTTTPSGHYLRTSAAPLDLVCIPGFRPLEAQA